MGSRMATEMPYNFVGVHAALSQKLVFLKRAASLNLKAWLSSRQITWLPSATSTSISGSSMASQISAVVNGKSKPSPHNTVNHAKGGQIYVHLFQDGIAGRWSKHTQATS